MAEEDKKKGIEIAKQELKIQLIEDRQKKDAKIQDIESRLNIAEEKKTNALNELKNKASNKINLLNNEVNKLKDDIERQSIISNLSLKNKVNEAVNNLEKEKTALINETAVNINQAFRATRPIIEFEAGLKLYNFGTEAKKTVDLLDTVTKDVFSTIEGSLGYNIDNVDLVDGMRILFIGDSDPMVYGKIYKVKFLLVNNRTQITLLEETDTNPLQDETVLISSGDTNSGKLYYYTGTVWSACQAKTAVNQAPLFDMYDNSNVQFNDVTTYQYSQFSGNKIFSYVSGTGNVDAELGFALTYRNIENTGDIVFNFNLAKESFTYVQDTTVLSLTTDKGFVRKYTDRTTFSSHNGWIKPDFNLSLIHI